MVCPHCIKAIHAQWIFLQVTQDNKYDLGIYHQICPSCSRAIIMLKGKGRPTGVGSNRYNTIEHFIYPKTISRAPLSSDVPDEFANDYKEACLVLSDSPKASAALGRRCLQNILREKAAVKKGDLSKEIDELLGSKQLPSYLAESVDAIRNYGNFAAHPNKSTSTGEIVDVEQGEAEWTLDVLEGLFDFYFVQPAEIQRKKDTLNKKLSDAGKPPMK